MLVYIFFYMPNPFRTWAIITLYHFLIFVTLGHFQILPFHFSPCSSMHPPKFVKQVTRCFLQILSYECYILLVIFPHYVYQKFQQSLSYCKCQFLCLLSLFSLKSHRCSPVLFMVFSAFVCRTAFLQHVCIDSLNKSIFKNLHEGVADCYLYLKIESRFLPLILSLIKTEQINIHIILFYSKQLVMTSYFRIQPAMVHSSCELQ